MPRHSDLRLRYDEYGNRLEGTQKDEAEKQRKQDFKERAYIKLEDERAKRQENAIQDLKKTVQEQGEQTNLLLKNGLKPFIDPGKNVARALASLTPIGMLAVKTYDVIKASGLANSKKSASGVEFPKDSKNRTDSTLIRLDNYLKYREKNDSSYKSYLKQLNSTGKNQEKIARDTLKETKVMSNQTKLLLVGTLAAGAGIVGLAAWLRTKFGESATVKNLVDSAKSAYSSGSTYAGATGGAGKLSLANYGTFDVNNIGPQGGTVTTPYKEYRVKDSKGNYVKRANGRIGGWTEAQAREKANSIGGRVVIHNALDIAHKYEGFPVYTPIAGSIIRLGISSSEGGTIVVLGGKNKAGNRLKWQVMHLQVAKGKVRTPAGVSKGSNVKAGQHIAYEGNTGASFGHHQHIAMWVVLPNGQEISIDPTSLYSPARNVGGKGKAANYVAKEAANTSSILNSQEAERAKKEASQSGYFGKGIAKAIEVGGAISEGIARGIPALRGISDSNKNISGTPTGGAAGLVMLGRNDSVMQDNIIQYNNYKSNAVSDSTGYKGTLPPMQSLSNAGVAGAGASKDREVIYFTLDDVLLNSLASNSSNVRMV